MIEIKINRADMDKVYTMLAGIKDAAPKAMVRALNTTLTGVKTDASAEIRNVITAKKKSVDETFRLVRATATLMSALFESKGGPLPLIDYSARQTKSGVSVQVKKATPRAVIPGTFIATVKSAHKGVFRRKWHDPNKATRKKIAYARLPKKYRLPISELFGPRVPDILSNAPVMASVLAKAEDRLHKNMEKELNFELSKLG